MLGVRRLRHCSLSLSLSHALLAAFPRPDPTVQVKCTQKRYSLLSTPFVDYPPGGGGLGYSDAFRVPFSYAVGACQATSASLSV
jgi:hypothetical protein